MMIVAVERFILPFLIRALLFPTESARAFSVPAASIASSSSSSSTKWSEEDIQKAYQITINARQKLYEDGVMDLKFDRPVQIKGEPVSSSVMMMIEEEEQKEEPTMTTTDDGVDNEEEVAIVDENKKETTTKTNTKIIHFQRHGQGFHNVLCDQWKELTGFPVNLESLDPNINPMLRNEVLDSPLSEKGRQECLNCREEASKLHPELIIMSPLLRAIQSAELTWTTHRRRSDISIPWMAHESCREELGLLICNKRRPISETQQTYPDIDFSFCLGGGSDDDEGEDEDDDTLFIPDHAESALSKVQRIYDFLLFVRDLPHNEIALIGHSAWLFIMCNAVMEINDEELKSWFLTSEIRSIKVTFEDRPEVTP